MLATILNWLSGGVAKAAIEAYRAKLAADGDADRLAADLAAKDAEARRAVLLAEQGNLLTRLVRPAFAAPFVIYTWKLVIWDKVLAWGSTDPLGPELSTLMSTIVAAYFGGRTLELIASKLARR